MAWLSERKDVLCALFYLSGLTAYLRYSEASTRASSVRRYLLCLALFVLALLSKPMAVTFPFVLIILDYYPLRRLTRSTFRTVLLEKVPFLALSLGDVVMNTIARGGASIPFSYVPLYMRIMNAFSAIVAYVRQTIYPEDLIPLVQLDRHLNYFGPAFVGSMILVLVVTGLCLWRAYKNDRLWAAIWFSYVITLFPALGFYMVFRHAMADRYTYVPTMGLWILFGLGVGGVDAHLQTGALVLEVQLGPAAVQPDGHAGLFPLPPTPELVPWGDASAEGLVQRRLGLEENEHRLDQADHAKPPTQAASTSACRP